MAWSAYQLMRSLPFWPIDVTLVSYSFWVKAQMDLVRALWAMLPAAILWGASFPLALASVTSKGQDPGRLVGGVYAANTVGAIIGSIGASLILVPLIGSQHIQQLLVAISGVSALLVLAVPAGAAKQDQESNNRLARIVLVVAATCGLMFLSVPELPKDFVAYGRFVPTRAGQSDVFYMGEGITAPVAVSRMPNGVLHYHNAGKIQASSDPADMRLQRMLGHLTTLIPTNAKTFLVIGCGAGVTAGAVSIEPRLESETIAEIEPLVPKVVSAYFGKHNFDVIRNPKVHVRIDDGRHFVLTSRDKFDGITSDPLDPWVKGAAALYTKEFFESAKAHLNPGGVVTQFIQLYESNEEAVKSEIATFMEVFPHGVVFANTIEGVGYDVVVAGQAEDMPIDIDRMQARLDSPEYARVARSLREIGFNSAVELLATYAGQAEDLKPWLKNAQINRDRNLRLQYLAGASLNQFQANAIYQNMVAFGPKMPRTLFKGSEARMELLSRAIQNGAARRPTQAPFSYQYSPGTRP
jgi:spermidine synthase